MPTPFIAMRVLVAFALLALMPGYGRAYEPPLPEIYTRILSRAPQLSRAIFHAKTTVYDAGQVVPSASDTSEIPPPPLLTRSYNQNFYWIRDRLLAIETLDLEGELLHFYFDEGLGITALSLVKDRLFSNLDIQHPFLPFLANSKAGWEKGLRVWGVLPAEATFYRAPKGYLWYVLRDSEHKAVWVETDYYRPVKLETTIQRGEQASVLSIEFDSFEIYGQKRDAEQNIIFPRSTYFLLDGILIKQTLLLSMDVEPSWDRFPLTRLRESANRYRQSLLEARQDPLDSPPQQPPPAAESDAESPTQDLPANADTPRSLDPLPTWNDR